MAFVGFFLEVACNALEFGKVIIDIDPDQIVGPECGTKGCKGYIEKSPIVEWALAILTICSLINVCTRHFGIWLNNIFAVAKVSFLVVAAFLEICWDTFNISGTPCTSDVPTSISQSLFQWTIGGTDDRDCDTTRSSHAILAAVIFGNVMAQISVAETIMSAYMKQDIPKKGLLSWSLHPPILHWLIQVTFVLAINTSLVHMAAYRLLVDFNSFSFAISLGLYTMQCGPRGNSRPLNVQWRLWHNLLFVSVVVCLGLGLFLFIDAKLARPIYWEDLQPRGWIGLTAAAALAIAISSAGWWLCLRFLQRQGRKQLVMHRMPYIEKNGLWDMVHPTELVNVVGMIGLQTRQTIVRSSTSAAATAVSMAGPETTKLRTPKLQPKNRNKNDATRKTVVPLSRVRDFTATLIGDTWSYIMWLFYNMKRFISKVARKAPKVGSARVEWRCVCCTPPTPI